MLVFATPKNWPRRHPASILSPATDHSLEAGEESQPGDPSGQRESPCRVARHRSQDATQPWRFEGLLREMPAMTFRLRMDGGDTVFGRDMQYQFNRLWLRMLVSLSASCGA